MNDFYVLVDHNQKMIIDHIKKLPENWNNIHGLNLLDPKKLSNLDWAGQTGLGWISVSDKLLSKYTSLPEWFEISKSGLKSLVASERWEKEHDIVFFKGNKLKLDDRTRSSLTLQKIGLNDTIKELKWKFFDGFVTLSVEDFHSLCDFVTTYIQGCFDEEQRLLDLYDSTTNLKNLVSTDFTANWPSNTFE